MRQLMICISVDGPSILKTGFGKRMRMVCSLRISWIAVPRQRDSAKFLVEMFYKTEESQRETELNLNSYSCTLFESKY